MDIWGALGKVRPAQQTVSDDARSRLARQDQLERDRMQRVEFDDEGNELLWFDVAITVGVHSGVPMPWPGKSAEEVDQAVAEWLRSDEFITVDFTDRGARSRLTFRTSFVAHWTTSLVGRKRR